MNVNEITRVYSSRKIKIDVGGGKVEKETEIEPEGKRNNAYVINNNYTFNFMGSRHKSSDNGGWRRDFI